MRRSAADSAPAAPLVLGLAALLGWWPHASATSLAAAFLSALAAAVAGARIARGPLRTWVLCLLPPLGGLIAARLIGALAFWSWPVPAPETVAALRDASIVAALTGGLLLPVAAAARRHAAARPLPAVLLVLAVARLFAAHRGGAIHRPHALADPAWLHGFHPIAVLAAIGVAAALAGGAALLRPSRRLLLHAAVLLLAGLALLRFAPEIGLAFSEQDPLGLSRDRSDRMPPVRSAGGREAGEERARGGGLGLTERGPDDGEGSPEMAPFRDEYSQEGARTPVAVVILHDDVVPFGGVFYFRQVAFSLWNGRRLVRSVARGVDVDLFRRFPTLRRIERPPPPHSPLRQEVPTTVSLLRDHAQPPVLAQGVAIAPAPVPDASLFKRSYHAESEVLVGDARRLLGREAGDPRWPEPVRRTYLALPPDPRYRELADATLATLDPVHRGDAWARALGVAIWLERNTRYSLRSHHASASDPTGSFLFGDRIGYCVHLAHAAAYLMRALGLPARVAAGYAYAAENRGGGSAILLRSGDAHAWAEVYLRGVGWVPIDPAPPSLDPPVPAPDPDLQRLLGELARPEGERLSADVPAPWRPPPLRRLLPWLALAFALWWLAGHAVKLWRRAAPRLARRDRTARTAYRAALDRLAEAGLSRRRGETRERFAARAAGTAPAIVPLTALHLRARFGQAPADPRRAAALAVSVGRQLRAAAGARLIPGLLAPYRWRRSR